MARTLAERSLAGLKRWSVEWATFFLLRASPVVLRSRSQSSLTSCKAFSPKVPRVSTAKGQNMYWLGKLEYKSSSRLWRPPPQLRETSMRGISYKGCRRTSHGASQTRHFPLDQGRNVRPSERSIPFHFEKNSTCGRKPSASVTSPYHIIALNQNEINKALRIFFKTNLLFYSFKCDWLVFVLR